MGPAQGGVLVSRGVVPSGEDPLRPGYQERRVLTPVVLAEKAALETGIAVSGKIRG